MRHLFGILLGVMMVSAMSVTWAQDDATIGSFGVGMEKDVTYVQVVTDRPYSPALDIKFPWKPFTNPSVEVRLITDPAADPNEIAPLYFGSDYFKGKMKQAAFDCRDAALSMGATKTIKVGDEEFKVVGLRTTPGGAGVYVARKLRLQEQPGGSVAAFHFLKGWSITPHRLYIDLPREFFAEKGDLYIWFTREGKPIWTQKVAWPGIGRQKDGQ